MSEKPPIGAEPAWLIARTRIQELAEEISRNADSFGSDSIDTMRKFATEICMQCDILRWDENNRNGRVAND